MDSSHPIKILAQSSQKRSIQIPSEHNNHQAPSMSVDMQFLGSEKTLLPLSWTYSDPRFMTKYRGHWKS